MNDMIFTNSFKFLMIAFNKFHHTDHRAGSPSHYLGYMISGNCKITTDSQTVMIKEGDVFYIPNKCRYQSYWYGNPEIRFISLGFSYFPNFDNKSYPVQVIPCDSTANESFFSLVNSVPLSAEDIGLFYTLVGTLMPKMSCKTICRTREIVEETKK